MRYYRIELADPISGVVKKVFTTFVNGRTDLGALLVELDIPVTSFAVPFGNAFVRVWGVALTDINQSANFNGYAMKVFGGMQKGLPLANPAQSGLLASGNILQAFGNWVGTDQSLDLIMTSSTGSPESQKNLVLNWRKGTTLASAIANTLKTAFPDYAQTININPKLVLNYDAPGYFGSLTQFSQFVKSASQSILGESYPGVSITFKDKAIVVYDGSSPTAPKPIAFVDLIGQPTWINPGQIQVKTPMRADLNVSDYVKLPPGTLVTTTAASLSQYRQSSQFQGTYQIDSVRHVGNSRQPGAASWVSNFDMHPVGANG